MVREDHRHTVPGIIVGAALVVAMLAAVPAPAAAWKGPGNLLEPFEQRVVELVNIERAKVGAKPLIVNFSLQEAAWRHTEHMAAKRVMCHAGCGDGDPQSRIKATGYKAATWGENVASGQRTPEDVMDDWMHSSGHRRNILSKNFTDIGVAYAPDGAYGTSWTQVFGTPERGYATVTPPAGGPGEEEPPAVCRLEYDFTGDGQVDGADVRLIKLYFLTTPRDPNWDAKYDIVADGVVNVRDIYRVAVSLGAKCGQP